MKKVIGVIIVAAVLCFWLMASLVIAAPPGSQTPQVQTGSQQLKQPLPLDQPLPSYPDIEPTSLKVFYENIGNPEPWKPGKTVLIRGYYQIWGCPQKPFFGKITMDGKTLIEKEMLQKPDCHSNNTSISFDAVLGTDWQETIGTHNIVFTVDSRADISEGLGESNNTLTETRTVQGPTLPKKDSTIQPTPEIIKPKPERPGWK
jgi:hypothetical protein